LARLTPSSSTSRSATPVSRAPPRSAPAMRTPPTTPGRDSARVEVGGRRVVGEVGRIGSDRPSGSRHPVAYRTSARRTLCW
jgi:hypothetical protein